MKPKKIWIILSIILTIFLLALVIKCCYQPKKENLGVMLGNKSEYLTFKNSYNDSFVYQYATSNYLNKMLEMDASKNVEKQIIKLSNLLKNASYVIINIGTYDLINQININEYQNVLTYDFEILKRTSEILISNVNNIINKIFSYNKTITIYLLSLVYPFNCYDEQLASLIENINDSYEKIANNKKINYITL